MKTHAYTYSILQYRHDAWTGECMNVGVLLYCPGVKFLQLRTRSGGTRISAAYPGIDRSSLLHDMREMERWFARKSKEPGSDWLYRSAYDIGTSLLGQDDSSFRWHLNGSGVTSNPNATLDQLFERFVTRYDAISSRNPRTDDQVFETVKVQLNQAELLSRVEAHTVSSAISEVTFEHSIKNGKWHCIQAISLDSADDDQMQRKAERWAGKLVGIQDAPEDFVVYMVTGRPADRHLNRQYSRMLELLRHAPTSPVVIEEEQSDTLVKKLASYM